VPETNSYTLHAVFVIVYLVVLIGVGAMKALKIKSQEDFSLAGRGLPTFVLVGTLVATWIGTGSIFGNAGETYRIGMPALLLPIAGGLGIIAIYFLAQRIRDFGQFTIQDILEARFGVGARILATIALLGAYVIIVSYQYRAGSAVVGRVFPSLEGDTAVYLVAAFVIAYTALAGMFSVAYTDVANGVMMIIGIACAIPFLLDAAGGWSHAIDALPDAQESLGGHWGVASLLGVLLPAFLLLIGDANMYQRFFSARDSGSAKRSAIWMFVGVLALEIAIIVTAILGSSLVAQGLLVAPENDGHIILSAAFDILPPFLGAMLVATIVAVVVSTADSYLLAPSTSVVRDIYQRFINPEAAGMQVVVLGRIVVVGLGLVALALAFASEAFFRVALFAYTIYGASITPSLLAAFFWKRANSRGAVASITVGALVALFWETVGFMGAREAAWALSTQDLLDKIGIGGLEAVLVAFPLSVLALVVVSLLSAPPSAEQANAI